MPSADGLCHKISGRAYFGSAGSEPCGSVVGIHRVGTASGAGHRKRLGNWVTAGHWRQWPAHRSAAVWEFLRAWWAHTLTGSGRPRA
jgi:hypothetical protein